jgi:hypothetical protein
VTASGRFPTVRFWRTLGGKLPCPAASSQRSPVQLTYRCTSRRHFASRVSTW